MEFKISCVNFEYSFKLFLKRTFSYFCKKLFSNYFLPTTVPIRDLNNPKISVKVSIVISEAESISF